LIEIDIPPFVEIIEESSFEGCTALEFCIFAESSSLVTIGPRAFAKCTSLRSFSIRRLVDGIDKKVRLCSGLTFKMEAWNCVSLDGFRCMIVRMMLMGICI
jgi:hypothetical protein